MQLEVKCSHNKVTPPPSVQVCRRFSPKRNAERCNTTAPLETSSLLRKNTASNLYVCSELDSFNLPTMGLTEASDAKITVSIFYLKSFAYLSRTCPQTKPHGPFSDFFFFTNYNVCSDVIFLAHTLTLWLR